MEYSKICKTKLKYERGSNLKVLWKFF